MTKNSPKLRFFTTSHRNILSENEKEALDVIALASHIHRE